MKGKFKSPYFGVAFGAESIALSLGQRTSLSGLLLLWPNMLL